MCTKKSFGEKWQESEEAGPTAPVGRGSLPQSVSPGLAHHCFLSPLRSLLDQLRKLQAMVIEIANKTSSGSTCVLVRLGRERDPFLGRNRRVTQPFISFFLCSRSSCFLSVFFWYLLCTPLTQGGVCQLSMSVRGHLKAWAVVEAFFSCVS